MAKELSKTNATGVASYTSAKFFSQIDRKKCESVFKLPNRARWITDNSSIGLVYIFYIIQFA